MSQPFEHVDRQRNRLLWLAGILMAAMCGALVLMSWSAQGAALEFDFGQRWPTLVGLAGMVVVFILYVQGKHRQLASMERRLRELAVREATLHARFSELSFLFDVTTQLQLRLDLQGMLDLAAQRLLPCLDAHQSSIMLHNEEEGVLEVKAASGIEAELVMGARMPSNEGIAGHVFTKGESLILTPEVIHTRFPHDIKRGRNIASGMCVPLRFRGSPIGVVNVSRNSGEAFSMIHVKMLETFAEHCAATVVKTHHHHELLKNVKRAA